MKLIRFGNFREESPGIILDGGRRIDVSNFGEDFDEQFFSTDGLRRLAVWVSKHAKICPEIPQSVRLGSCVAKPSKIVCVGLNYAGHAAESGLDVPREPVLFLKATSALSGPNDDVVLPRGSEKTDWEVELAVVIGKTASYVSREDAMSCVAGYCLHNDYSERSFQLERGGQWVKGKSCDSFGPLGPVLVTADEVPDPHKLGLWLKVNGTTMQESTAADLIFDVPFLISYISQFMTLLPGDVLSTGTPQGVGAGHQPPRYLRHGDLVEFGIDGLGSARQRIVRQEHRGDQHR